MKTLLIFLLFFGLILIGVPVSAQTVVIPNPLGDSGSDIPTLIESIATWLLEIGISIGVIIVLWAAILFMTAGGNKERAAMARKTLWYAIIGLAVLLLSTGVSLLITNFLSGNFGP